MAAAQSGPDLHGYSLCTKNPQLFIFFSTLIWQKTHKLSFSVPFDGSRVFRSYALGLQISNYLTFLPPLNRKPTIITVVVDGGGGGSVTHAVFEGEKKKLLQIRTQGNLFVQTTK